MSSPSSTVACTSCGALNGADFGRCVRCNERLHDATPAEGARRRVAARRPPRHPALYSERLLGRWPSTALPATKLLVALNTVVFAFHLLISFRHAPGLDVLLKGGTPLEAFRFGALPVGKFLGVAPLDDYLMRAEPWRLLSACFVHYGVLHFGMNMLGLIYLARLSEPAIGSVRFIIVYVASGVIGFASTIAWFLLFPSAMWTAGASGAVFGLMGMILGFLWRRRDPRWKTWLGQVVVYSLGFTLLLSSVNNSAHIGGLLSGMAIGALFAPGAPQPSRTWQRWLAGACVLAAVLSLLAAQRSPYLPVLNQLTEQRSR